jgi:hypothetical protein
MLRLEFARDAPRGLADGLQEVAKARRRFSSRSNSSRVIRSVFATTLPTRSSMCPT